MGKKRLSFAANWRFIQLNLKEIAKSDGCGAASLSYDRVAMRDRTRKAPVWLHFGSGNIFRAFPCALQDTLLSEGIVDYGIIAAETFDFEIIEKYIARTMIFRCLLLSAQTGALVAASSEA